MNEPRRITPITPIKCMKVHEGGILIKHVYSFMNIFIFTAFTFKIEPLLMQCRIGLIRHYFNHGEHRKNGTIKNVLQNVRKWLCSVLFHDSCS